MKTTKTSIKKFLQEHQVTLENLGIAQIGLFGSFVKDKQKEDSDIDLLVKFSKNKKTYKNFISAAFFIEDGLGRKVDLVTEESLSPYIKPYVLKEVESLLSTL